MSTTWDSAANARTASSRDASETSSFTGALWQLAKAMGSLKITVTMFGFGILILLVGTLAQDEETLVDVKANYFNSWFATVSSEVFFPVTIFEEYRPPHFSFPMPGGATIGLILLINLIAAKMTRFTMHARGGMLAGGLFFCGLGLALLLLVVIGAHRGDGLQGEPPFSYDSLWMMTKASLWIATVASLGWAIVWPPKYRLVRALAWSVVAIAVGLTAIVWFAGDSYRISDPGLRIVWQLAKSFMVGGTLLVGMLMLFGKRGGNVLIHFGVGLLMIGQFTFGDQQVEERVTLFEGQATNLAYRPDQVELAIMETGSDGKDKVMAIDDRFLQYSARHKKGIEVPNLPFEIQVEEWMINSTTEPFDPDLENKATQGIGLRKMAVEATKYGGASDKTNLASAYISFLDRNSKKSVGTFLLSQLEHDPAAVGNAAEEVLAVDGREFRMQLRFRQTIKDYQVVLDDVKREDYRGTETPRDYSSDIRIVSVSGEPLQKGHIWMNNPIRFKGETFYQSGYVSAEKTGIGIEQSTLQVVANAGWLIPYVSCVLCGLGMMVHFGGTFARFASRYDRSQLPREKWSPYGFAIGGGLVAILTLYSAFGSRATKDEFDWRLAAELPMLHEGRVKPLDTVARNVLQATSNRTSVVHEEKRLAATQWLISLMAGVPWTLDAHCIRVEPESLQILGLKRREGLRYSYNEVGPKMPAVYEIVNKLDPEARSTWSTLDKQLHLLGQRVGIFESVMYGYTPLVPKIPTEAEGEAGIQEFRQKWDMYREIVKMVERSGTPAIIPPSTSEPDSKWEKAEWQAYGPAIFHWVENQQAGIQKEDRASGLLGEMMGRLKEGNPKEFNIALKKFRSSVIAAAPSERSISRTKWEAWYNRFGPITLCTFFYVFAGLCGAIGVMIQSSHVRRGTFWMCVGIFLVHTFAIYCRYYISDRPPVVNLYSSAVFIGWAIMLMGLIMEAITPIGLGSIVGSIAGFLSLLVAYALDTGDTMPVLQAVLDTQFWLTTHVICVTVGYSATYCAGILAIAYLIFRLANYGSQSADKEQWVAKVVKQLDQATYGIVCAALFFSFVGTVLGGLWGDDSWGRFWGWDPKENGALMIVLWNALLLHARWDKMVSHRGFAMLAIGGNIITSWSWFGTNQLGIGLHSYGFNTGILQILGWVVLSQIVLIIVGVTLVKPLAKTNP